MTTARALYDSATAAGLKLPGVWAPPDLPDSEVLRLDPWCVPTPGVELSGYRASLADVALAVMTALAEGRVMLEIRRQHDGQWTVSVYCKNTDATKQLVMIRMSDINTAATLPAALLAACEALRKGAA